MGHSKISYTKQNLDNLSKEPINAFVKNIKTWSNITHPFIVIFRLSYHGKLVIYEQDTKRHPTVVLTHVLMKYM